MHLRQTFLFPHLCLGESHAGPVGVVFIVCALNLALSSHEFHSQLEDESMKPYPLSTCSLFTVTGETGEFFVYIFYLQVLCSIQMTT